MIELVDACARLRTLAVSNAGRREPTVKLRQVRAGVPMSKHRPIDTVIKLKPAAGLICSAANARTEIPR